MIILVIFVIIIVAAQFWLFSKSLRLISRLKGALDSGFNTFKGAKDTLLISFNSEVKNTMTSDIIESLNTYMVMNQGAVSDFHLIKDIVERTTDTLEEEIDAQTPIPLYLGLMGTVVGIVIGLFSISMSGGISNIETAIDSLLSEVSVAMIATLAGIFCTTATIWSAKKCKATVERNKNRFYTWFQTNLLPGMSRSALSAITLLQQNLTHFNNTFGETVERLDRRMAGVGDVYESQLEVLDKIESIDVKRIATANVKVLASLEKSMSSLDRFATYMSSLTEYLNAMRDLNEKLDSHLERTETLGVVSDFYKNQMQEISLRQDAIRESVVAVDDVMKETLAALRADSSEHLKAMKETYLTQLQETQDSLEKQGADFAKQLERLPRAIDKIDEISAIPAKLNKIIDGLEKSQKTMLARAERDNGKSEVQVSHEGKQGGSWNLPIFVVLVLIAILCFFHLIMPTRGSSQTETTDSPIVEDSLTAVPDTYVERDSGVQESIILKTGTPEP